MSPTTHTRPAWPSRLLAAFAGLLAALLALPAVAAAAVDENGAGGSPVDQILIATVGASVVTIFLLYIGLGHRAGRVRWLGRLADFAGNQAGLPNWVALPSVVATISLLTAVFGMYWDIALHIDVGRDAGPLANPAHYFILIGLYGIFSAGFLAVTLPMGGDDQPGPSGFQLAPTWRAPLGGVLILACGAFSLIGFPLDDVWHRIFGQDVTLWGPTHLMLIGGASMTLIGMAVLITEGLRANARLKPPRIEWAFTTWARKVALGGGFILALATFQAEFDFGIPQFRFVFQPALMMLAAGVGLVAIRIWGGRGAALGGVLFYLAIRAILSITVGPVLGQTMPSAPLYLVEAIIVELVALRFVTTRPLSFGVACGIGLATVGLAAEWAWSQVAMPFPMPETLISTGVPFGIVGAMAGALMGAWIGTKLLVDPVPSDRGLRRGAVVGAIGLSLIVAIGLYKPPIEGATATVAVTDAPIAAGEVGAGGRSVLADVQFSPVTAADDALWLTITSWQGGGLIIDHLERVGPGRYRSTQPVPVHGSWKTLIRLHVGRSLMATPIYQPVDTAIPAPEVPALPQFTRPLVTDFKVFQREQVPAPPALTIAAYVAVAGIALGLLVLLVWGMHRLGRIQMAPPVPVDAERTRKVAAAG